VLPLIGSSFYVTLRASGLTFNLSKSSFAQPEVTFIGHFVGFGYRRVNPDNVSSIMGIKIPKTKGRLDRSIWVIFFFQRIHAKRFSLGETTPVIHYHTRFCAR